MKFCGWYILGNCKKVNRKKGDEEINLCSAFFQLYVPLSTIGPNTFRFLKYSSRSVAMITSLIFSKTCRQQQVKTFCIRMHNEIRIAHQSWKYSKKKKKEKQKKRTLINKITKFRQQVKMINMHKKYLCQLQIIKTLINRKLF